MVKKKRYRNKLFLGLLILFVILLIVLGFVISDVINKEETPDVKADISDVAQGVEEEVRDENTQREDEDCRVWGQLALCRRYEVVDIHTLNHKAVEGRHQKTGDDGQNDTLLAVCAAIALFRHAAGRHAVADDSHNHKEHNQDNDDRSTCS